MPGRNSVVRKGYTTTIPYGNSKIQKAVKLHIFKKVSCQDLFGDKPAMKKILRLLTDFIYPT